MMTDVKINAEACINAEYKINANERIDDLCRDNLKLIQNTDVFCFGMDAVLLSSFAALRNKDTVMDLCTGTGILPILLSAKTKADHIDALEVQKESAEMARRSIILNELSNRITIYEGDVKTASDQFGKNCYAAANSVIAIIGGADGPTTITVGVPDQKSIHVACSALHFEPVDEDIEWRIEFSVDEPLKETFQLV